MWWLRHYDNTWNFCIIIWSVDDLTATIGLITSTGCPSKTTPFVYYHRKSFSKFKILSRLLSFLITFWNGGWNWKLQNHHQSKCLLLFVTLCMRQLLSSCSKVGKIFEPWSKFSNLKIFFTLWNSEVIMQILAKSSYKMKWRMENKKPLKYFRKPFVTFRNLSEPFITFCNLSEPFQTFPNIL